MKEFYESPQIEVIEMQLECAIFADSTLDDNDVNYGGPAFKLG